MYGGEGDRDLQMNLTQRTSESLINPTLDCNTYAVTKTHTGGTKLFLLNNFPIDWFSFFRLKAVQDAGMKMTRRSDTVCKHSACSLKSQGWGSTSWVPSLR